MHEAFISPGDKEAVPLIDDASDSQMTCFHTDLRDTEELLRRLAWRTEAIDHLIDEIGECFLIFDRGKTPS